MVTVPAGTFPTAIHYRHTYYGPAESIGDVEDSWFVPDVGLVKMTDNYTDTGIFVLTAYTR